MPGLTGELVVTTLVCFLLCTRGCGCIGARHSPRPLIFGGGDFMHTSGASRRENAEVCLSLDVYLSVIARSPCDEAIHSFFTRLYGLLRFARNDGRGVAPHSPRHRPRTRRTRFQRRLRMNREAAYWIVRSSRTMTVERALTASWP